MLTGRQARTSTWPVMDEWFDQWSAQDRVKSPDPGPSEPQDRSSGTIGSNPRRRFGSSASRNLRS
jgi:polyhydroxyalkanoate synthase